MDSPHTRRPVLSHFQGASLLEARNQGDEATEVSLDLGLSVETVRIEADGVLFPRGDRVRWRAVREIADSPNACFTVDGDEIEKIQVFSDLTQKPYSLMPTQGAPTMLVAGKTMHRIKRTDPWKDTLSKINAIKPVSGWVLDTCTGLGYTAIVAARTAGQVFTVELDPSALIIAEQNPWSSGLFDTPAITQILGDCFDRIDAFEDGAFTRILHDPPVFNFDGRLYSMEFYCKLYAKMKPKGRLYHYIGNPDSRRMAGITRGVMDRLRQAGFSRVRPEERAFGVTAVK